MSAEPVTPAADDAATVDERNPWLGLASFTEETRGYFYGRDEEVAELARRVQRKLLTMLFGQSGLGKTSILRAGLVPKLRGQGYCPVYVRIDYGRDAPEPADQIKQAIARTARRSGQWTQVGVAVEGESLWEFLHHRDDVLLDEHGETLIPLLIFDQFEEIFTLGQTDDFGRARAQRFISDLADLVENRPPAAFEARLERDEAAAEKFDFARSDYRVLIALREDYLAPLEGLKGVMPSVTQNRLRLAPMTGRQALEAVLRPGRRLVSQEVAEAIVRFVAGGAELANAEVEPSLLSLICRELNDTRIAAEREEISLDLLAGTHETILVNFYERSLADQPAALRRVIEDELLTESGFRENVAEERIIASFAAAGAAPDALATLVNRRLLRIEERLDVRRVEITHDVLCGVVKQSRDLRHEREARDEAERALNEQRERARAARRSLIRARQIAAVCGVLALGAIIAAGLAIRSTMRARAAEQAAEQARVAADETRILAEQARGQAEQLLGYLTEDFSRELAGSGRLDVAAELARREIDYFKALPAPLKGGETTRNGALAMVYYARAMRGLGKVAQGEAAVNEAVRLLDELKSSGDNSEATTTALGLALLSKASVLDVRGDNSTLATAERAASVLAPVATARGAEASTVRAYAEALERLGFLQERQQTHAVAAKTLELARDVAARGGARDLSSPDMTAEYVIASSWLVDALRELNRVDEGRRVGNDAIVLAQQLVERRPSYLLGLRGLQLTSSSLGALESGQMRLAAARTVTERGLRIGERLLRLDPADTIVANNVLVDASNISDSEWSLGRARASLATLRGEPTALKVVESGGSNLFLSGTYHRLQMIDRLTELGDIAAAQKVLSELEALVAMLKKRTGEIAPFFANALCQVDWGAARIALYRGDRDESRAHAMHCLAFLRATRATAGEDAFYRNLSAFFGNVSLAQTELERHDPAGVERAARAALEVRKAWPAGDTSDRRWIAIVQSLLAIGLAEQGNREAAARAVAPAVALQRDLLRRNTDDAMQHLELAIALYAQALAEPAQRAALLHEADGLVGGLPTEMQSLRTVVRWRERIREASRPT